MTSQQERIDEMAADVRSRFTLEAFTRRAIAQELHSAWVRGLAREDQDRQDRMETMMSTTDYELARRHLLTPVERDKVRQALSHVPATVRDDLDRQQYNLATIIRSDLIAEHRRRVAEVRCWLIDAIEHIDALDFREARRLVVDGEHSLGFMLATRANSDSHGRNRFEFDRVLRSRTEAIARALRQDAIGLREACA